MMNNISLNETNDTRTALYDAIIALYFKGTLSRFSWPDIELFMAGHQVVHGHTSSCSWSDSLSFM
ncbi:hypothetical protein MAR_021839, partial [Mya arenaria]